MRSDKGMKFENVIIVSQFFVFKLTHSHTITPFDVPGKQTF